MHTTQLLEAALDYAARLGPVFPLFTPVEDADGVWRCDCPQTYKDRGDCSPGKHPRTEHGSKDASRDPERITRWWTMFPHANIGIALDDLVDIGPDDLGWHQEFLQRGLPPTFTFASSGPGHMHYLYRRPPECPSWRICKQHEYDILSNGYVVGPGSRHISGETYLLADGRDPTEPPTWAVEALVEAANRPKAAGIIDGEDVAAGDELERIIESIPRDVWLGLRYDDRSTSLVAIAGEAAKAGASKATIRAIVAERDVSLGMFKYANRSAEQADRAYTAIALAAYERNPPDVRLGTGNGKGPNWASGNGNQSQEIPVPGQNSGTKNREREFVLKLWANDDMAARSVDSTLWHCRGLIGPGLMTELDGWAKLSGKTTFTLALIRSLLRGEPFLDLATSQTNVVYLTEQTWASLLPNVRKAGLEHAAGLHWAFYDEAYGVPWAKVIGSAVEQAKALNAGLLVVDTLAQWSGLKGDIENNSGTAYQILASLQPACAAGLAVLILRHDKKSGGEVTISARGSSAYAAVMDVVLRLSPLVDETANPRYRMLEGTGRFADETPQKLVISLSVEEPLAYTALGDLEAVASSSAEQRVWNTLAPTEEFALERDALIDLSGVRRQDAIKALHVMLKDGRIQRGGNGKKGDAYKYWRRTYEVSDD